MSNSFKTLMAPLPVNDNSTQVIVKTREEKRRNRVGEKDKGRRPCQGYEDGIRKNRIFNILRGSITKVSGTHMGD